MPDQDRHYHLPAAVVPPPDLADGVDIPAYIADRRKRINDERFAQALLSSPSNAEAYRTVFPRAYGWQAQSVATEACAWAAEPHIIRRVAELQAEAAEAAAVTADWIVLRLRQEALAGDLTKPSLPRVRALELLAKYRGMMTERVEHTGSGGGDIQIRYIRAEGPAGIIVEGEAREIAYLGEGERSVVGSGSSAGSEGGSEGLP